MRQFVERRRPRQPIVIATEQDIVVFADEPEDVGLMRGGGMQWRRKRQQRYG